MADKWFVSQGCHLTWHVLRCAEEAPGFGALSLEVIAYHYACVRAFFGVVCVLVQS
jgi:hypothetical protein